MIHSFTYTIHYIHYTKVCVTVKMIFPCTFPVLKDKHAQQAKKKNETSFKIYENLAQVQMSAL